MKTEKVKSVPLRMCIVCKEMIPKKELLRIVKTNDDKVFIDTTNKANGRGAYICGKPKCVEVCFKKKYLNKVFKTEIPADVYQKLTEEYENNVD